MVAKADQCIRPGCLRKAHALGVCARCYARAWREVQRPAAPDEDALDAYLDQPRDPALLEPAMVPRPLYDGRGRLLGWSVWSGGLLFPYIQRGLAVTMRWDVIYVTDK